jgi:hypothetical protein
MKMNDPDCVFFEQLLLKQEVEKIDAAEKQLLEEHLRSCANCVNFRKILAELGPGAAFETENELVPDKRVLTNLQRELRRKWLRAGLRKKFWQRTRQLVMYRLPVYQAAFAGLVLMISFLTYLNFQQPQERELFESVQCNPEKIAFVRPDSALLQLKSIGKQSGGRNVQEDSALTRFLISL